MSARATWWTTISSCSVPPPSVTLVRPVARTKVKLSAIIPGDEQKDPQVLAEKLWQMHSQRSQLRVFATDLTNCTELTLEQWNRRGTLTRVLEYLIKPLGPLM